MTAKAIISRVLTAFVLISIGYAAGKEMALRTTAQNGGDTQQTVAAASSEDKVIVYYMHATFRCFTSTALRR